MRVRRVELAKLGQRADPSGFGMLQGQRIRLGLYDLFKQVQRLIIGGGRQTGPAGFKLVLYAHSVCLIAANAGPEARRFRFLLG